MSGRLLDPPQGKGTAEIHIVLATKRQINSTIDGGALQNKKESKVVEDSTVIIAQAKQTFLRKKKPIILATRKVIHLEGSCQLVTTRSHLNWELEGRYHQL